MNFPYTINSTPSFPNSTQPDPGRSDICLWGVELCSSLTISWIDSSNHSIGLMFWSFLTHYKTSLCHTFSGTPKMQQFANYRILAISKHRRKTMHYTQINKQTHIDLAYIQKHLSRNKQMQQQQTSITTSPISPKTLKKKKKNSTFKNHSSPKPSNLVFSNQNATSYIEITNLSQKLQNSSWNSTDLNK